jgi:tRNA pseudouridine38-40 synthase
MPRFRMTIAYDGTAYAGWQRQPNRPTIQQTIEDALARLTSSPVAVHACGRTDAGVHARAQVAHFDLPDALPPVARDGSPLPAAPRRPPRPAALQYALNAILPPDIRILRLARADPSFHARYDALWKEYRYTLWNAPVLPPHLRHTVLHVPKPRLDLPAMRAAAALLVGRRDFAAFSANPHRETDGTVRTLLALRIAARGPLVTISASGDGFLYKMVRSLAGHLLRVGKGRIPAAETAAILASRTRTARVETAPARALSLHAIHYPPPPALRRPPAP